MSSVKREAELDDFTKIIIFTDGSAQIRQNYQTEDDPDDVIYLDQLAMIRMYKAMKGIMS